MVGKDGLVREILDVVVADVDWGVNINFSACPSAPRNAYTNERYIALDRRKVRSRCSVLRRKY
jgi:hypothetical protein